jgi:hypothetical protein
MKNRRIGAGELAILLGVKTPKEFTLWDEAKYQNVTYTLNPSTNFYLAPNGEYLQVDDITPVNIDWNDDASYKPVVIYRKDDVASKELGREIVIACFPEELGTNDWRTFTVYSKQEQHGIAALGWYLEHTSKPSDHCAADMHQHLDHYYRSIPDPYSGMTVKKKWIQKYDNTRISKV